MELKIWSKTLLSVYKTLETVVSAIDKFVLAKGINSAYFNCKNYKNAYDCMNKMVDLTDRKRKLINLKVIIESSLVKLSNEDQNLLMLYYFDNVKCVDIAKILNISIRTFFRKKDLAINRFANQLRFNRFDNNYLSSNYCNEQWLMDFYYYKSNEKDTNEDRYFNGKNINRILSAINA